MTAGVQGALPEDQGGLSADLSAALVCDACVRLGLEVRVAPVGIRPIDPSTTLGGPARPVRHYGSVDVYLEAIELAAPGEVLVIDNGGRLDEGCVGDLTAIEAKMAGLAGLVVWGAHRDEAQLGRIGWPVFSYGTCPSGPRRLDPRDDRALISARFGSFTVGARDTVFADADGVIFVATDALDAVVETAAAIATTERDQARLATSGISLREQLQFGLFRERRRTDPAYSFRDHLRVIGGAIEE